MVLVNCLWVGLLAGMVGSRLIRGRRGFVSTTSSIAVALLGALIGLVVEGRFEQGARLPHGDIISAGVGAAIALCVWAIAHRCFLHEAPER